MSELRTALDQLFERARQTASDPSDELAAIYDRTLAERFAAAVGTERLCLVATGGWARRELAPFSDIDFIIVHANNEAGAKEVCDRLLYPLWDDKLSIGHAVRQPRAAARLARDDLATATALLDARYIAGDRELGNELVAATLAAIAPSGNPNQLIAMLAAEQRDRHDRFGATLYLLEPNLKHGIGGQRDLATALWCAKARWYPDHELRGSQLIGALATDRHLTDRQAQLLAAAHAFHQRIRALVQLTSRRRLDQLTFELQEAIAPRLPSNRNDEASPPLTQRAVAPAVESLMRDYYLHARAVRQVGERLIDAARVTNARRSARRPLSIIDDSFAISDGVLVHRRAEVFTRPSEMVRLFRVAVAHGVAVASATRELVAEVVARDPQALATDRDARRLLYEALLDISDAGQPAAFEVMHQLGILAAILPGWAPCTARVQHDLYHVYTVDQHQLYALALQKRLARGDDGALASGAFACELWRTVARPGPLLLATLLHDVGKPLGKGHAEKGAVIAGEVARTLAMAPADVELTEFLVRQHLTMAHLSQRRDLSDPDVIARFAERIGDDERLVQLYLVTLCDTAMTAPDNLTAWKDELLRELVVRTRTVLGGERTPDQPAAPDPRERVLSLVGDSGVAVERARAIIDAIDPRLFVQLTPRQSARHVRLIDRAVVDRTRLAIEVHCWPLKGHSELAIVAPDAPGVLAAIAGALTANRIDVLGAVLGHATMAGEEVGLATDVFYVRDLKGSAIPEDDPRWARFGDDLRALVAAGSPDPRAVAELIARRRPPSGLPARVTPRVATEIKLHDESSAATIIDVATHDRVGVLYEITHTLAELGLDISLAKIATEGEKVADAFYVTRHRHRIEDPAERAAIVARLSEALAR